MKTQILTFFIVIMMVGCNSKESKKVGIQQPPSTIISNPLSPEGVLALMEKTSQWQINKNAEDAKIKPVAANNWMRATFLMGMMAYYDVSKKEAIFDYVNNLCKEGDYSLGYTKAHPADDFTIGSVYADIYLKTQDEKVIASMISRLDSIIADPNKFSDDGWKTGWPPKYGWSWNGALFCAPPSWLKMYTCTGKRKYLNEMSIGFLTTSNRLYSPVDSLIYSRDDFIWDRNGNGKKSLNGNKIFWGRGNGWVISSLTQMLTYLPGDFPERDEYKNMFVEMAAKLASIQGEDGMWRSSLLDVEQFPTKEFSGSAFFCQALAWGINHKILDKEKYWPHVQKAYLGLVSCIDENGRIGYVQPSGAEPSAVDPNNHVEYATSGFLLASKEVFEIVNQ